jgi:hypothetical protein
VVIEALFVPDISGNVLPLQACGWALKKPAKGGFF